MIATTAISTAPEHPVAYAETFAELFADIFGGGKLKLLPPHSPSRWYHLQAGLRSYRFDQRTLTSLDWFQRLHGGRSPRWFGEEANQDAHGNTWFRHYWAVIDDFGNLVEVAS